ncbi:DUF4880 domain-containing protein [Gluconacetobacter sacchari]|uniref:DUF4880 domain-containing protein n=2 Tax=Gluconacetobacter sacchari TaxID=92759 RepID=A0A7W4NQK3_9PROT|nr:DUF4880 domain-containing protein [Gluconacetobacter sacchari]
MTDDSGPAASSRPDARTEQAGRWAARHDRGPLPPPERARFDRWLNDDSRNLGAYVRAQAIYRALNYTTAETPLPLQPGRAQAATGRRRVLVGAAAACAAGLLARPVPPDRITLLRREQEAPRRYAWQDATITLDALSAAYVPASAEANRGAGQDAGQGIRVLSGRVGVQAARRTVGLSAGGFLFHAADADFDLALESALPTLVAYRGAILLSDGGRHTVLRGPAIYHLADGGAAPAAHPLTPTGALARRAWRDAQSVLSNTPLAEAVAQFSRYSHTRIEIASDRIARDRVTGSFNLLRPAEFARSVQRLLGCHLTESGNRLILS